MVLTATRTREPVAAPKTHRFPHVDFLRALAVCLVIFSHSGYNTVLPGGTGVTIFFSISGFIITYLLLKEYDQTNGFRLDYFYGRRALKIIPPLLLLLCVPTLLWALTHDLNGPGFLSQLFFGYNWWVIYGNGQGIPQGTNVIWSLAVEEQFYIAIAIVWFIGVRLRQPRRILTLVALALLVISVAMRFHLAQDPTNAGRIYYGTDTRMDALALGMLSALLLSHWDRGGTRLSTLRRVLSSGWVIPAAVGAVSISALQTEHKYFYNTSSFLIHSVAACAVLLAGFQLSGSLSHLVLRVVSRLRLVTVIGLASYSTYLVNLVLVQNVSAHWDSGRGSRFVVCLILCNLVGYLAWRWLEVPFERIRARLRSTSPGTLSRA